MSGNPLHPLAVNKTQHRCGRWWGGVGGVGGVIVKESENKDENVRRTAHTLSTA